MAGAPRYADAPQATSTVVTATLFCVAVFAFLILRACRFSPCMRWLKGFGLPMAQYGWRNPPSIHVLTSDEESEEEDSDAAAGRALVEGEEDEEDDEEEDQPAGRPEVL